MIAGTLNNQVSTSALVTFDVTIFNDCANDSIVFDNQIESPQNMDLFAGLAPLALNPVVNQYNTACPRSCALTVDPAF